MSENVFGVLGEGYLALRLHLNLRHADSLSSKRGWKL